MEHVQITCDGSGAIGDGGRNTVSVRSQLATPIRLFTGWPGRILVIDDDELARATVREILESGGHEVVEASSGDSGIRICRKELIDLVIMDLLMPRKGGLETIWELHEEFPNTKIIAISGVPCTGPMSPLVLAWGYGASRSLEKPVTAAGLLRNVRELIARE